MTEDSCKICRGTGSMEAKHPFDGAPVYVECWCTDDHEYTETLWPPARSDNRALAEKWYNIGYNDAGDTLYGPHDFNERWGTVEFCDTEWR